MSEVAAASHPGRSIDPELDQLGCSDVISCPIFKNKVSTLR